MTQSTVEGEGNHNERAEQELRNGGGGGADNGTDRNDEEQERQLILRASLAARLRQEQLSLNTGTPTRTLRLTHQEQSSSRDPTPSEIANRSPRPRTPRQRLESPLDHDALRRGGGRGDDAVVVAEEDDRRTTAQRVTIRLHAGMGVGERAPMAARNRPSLSNNNIAEGRPLEPSAKQGPSHRKVRRWNNDRLADLDLTSAKVKSIYAKARSEAHLYRAVYNPNEDCQRSDALTRFLNDETMKGTRDMFFDGSGPAVMTSAQQQQRAAAAKRRPPPEKHSLARIEPRLRRLVVRAGNNSCAATKVLQRFEDCILQHYFPELDYETVLPAEWWTGLLEGEPTTTRKNTSDETAVEEDYDSKSLLLDFVFPDTPNAGFHRLLLHAVCQFHGLKATARNTKAGDSPEMRMSCVSGRIEETPVDGKLPISIVSCLEAMEG